MYRKPGLTSFALPALLALAPVVSGGQTTIDWTTVLSHSGRQVTTADVATDAAGATFVVATVDFADIRLVRIGADGNVDWSRTFDTGGQDSAEAVALSWDESAVYVLGNSSMPTTSADYAVLKYDASSGALLWSRFIDGGDQGLDVGRDIAATPDGGAVATGGFDTPTEQRDFGTARLDASGNVLWTQLYTGFGQFLFAHDDAKFVAVNGAGDVVVTGDAKSGSDSDIVTLRYDGGTGAQVWEARWEGGANDVAEGLEFTPNGGVAMFGIDDFTSGRRWVLATYEMQDGAERWSRLVDLGREEHGRHLAVGADGTVYATGSYDPDVLSNGNGNLAAVAVDGVSGALLWTTRFGGGATNEADYGARIYPDGSGSVWIVGGTATASVVGGSPGDEDGLLLELSAATGGQRSITLLDTPSTTSPSRDDLRHIGLDGLGRLYAVGTTATNTRSTLAARFQLGSCYANLGGSLAGSAGAPELDASGLVAPGQTISVSLTSGLPSSTTSIVAGFSSVNSPLYGGTLVPSPDLVLPPLPLDATGSLTLGFKWPAFPSGTTLFLQAWIDDPSGPAGFSASNGLSIRHP